MRKLRTATITGAALAAALLLATPGCAPLWPQQDDGLPSMPSESLPEDPDPKQSAAQAEDFRAYIARHGTGSRREAVQHVQKIFGSWADSAGRAFIVTDLPPGDQQPAELIIGAYTDWRLSLDPGPGLIGVYGKTGHLTATNFPRHAPDPPGTPRGPAPPPPPRPPNEGVKTTGDLA
ncbi:hypothetical protein [Streptomyces gobiensis]|uniref:hypothetical protein n=1 Tax=Streptomyces gobiensis TaxID=2875706 RepID=UPI001E52BB57|nr:hypothetical protein [Streptomyces gobiensis]UGY92767.1 hypothetical protein test1122_14275 [Streptomyces gobiensis]